MSESAVDPAVQEAIDMATAAVQAAEAEHMQPQEEVVLNYVEIAFPVRLVLLHENLIGRTGQIGRFQFENGVSELMSYKDARQFSLNYRVNELSTGVYFSPVTEGRLWRAKGFMTGRDGKDTRMWLYGQDLDPDVQAREDAHVAGLAQASAELAETLRQAANDQAGASGDAPEDPSTINPTAMAEIANRVANAMAASELLGRMRDLYGARFVRQLCETRGLKTDRSGDVMIKTLIESGITVTELELARPKDDKDLAIRPGDVMPETEDRVGGDVAA